MTLKALKFLHPSFPNSNDDWFANNKRALLDGKCKNQLDDLLPVTVDPDAARSGGRGILFFSETCERFETS